MKCPQCGQDNPPHALLSGLRNLPHRLRRGPRNAAELLGNGAPTTINASHTLVVVTDLVIAIPANYRKALAMLREVGLTRVDVNRLPEDPLNNYHVARRA